MRVTYDPEVDILGLELREDVTADYGEEIAPGITALFDAQGVVVALDIADYAERYGQKAAEQVIVEHYQARPEDMRAVRAAADRTAKGSPDLSSYVEGYPETWCSIPEAARRVGVSDQAIRKAVKEGRLRGLPSVVNPKHIMVALADLEQWQPDPVRQAAGKARGGRTAKPPAAGAKQG